MIVVESACSLWALLPNVVSSPSSKRHITSTNRTPIAFGCHSYLFWNILYPIKYAKQSWSIERPLLNGNLQRVATSLQAFRKFRLSRKRFPFQGQHSNIVFTVVIAPGLSYMSVSQYQCLPYWIWIYFKNFTPFMSILETINAGCCLVLMGIAHISDIMHLSCSYLSQ